MPRSIQVPWNIAQKKMLMSFEFEEVAFSSFGQSGYCILLRRRSLRKITSSICKAGPFLGFSQARLRAKMFLERSFFTVAVYVRRMKSTSNPPGVWKRILPFFWGSLHHCQLFWRKNQEKAGVSGWTTPWPSSGASLHYGQWAGAGDSHGKEHRGTRDESQGLLVQSQPKLVRKNGVFHSMGFHQRDTMRYPQLGSTAGWPKNWWLITPGQPAEPLRAKSPTGLGRWLHFHAADAWHCRGSSFSAASMQVRAMTPSDVGYKRSGRGCFWGRAVWRRISAAFGLDKTAGGFVHDVFFLLLWKESEHSAAKYIPGLKTSFEHISAILSSRNVHQSILTIFLDAETACFLVHLGLRMDRSFAMPFHNTSEKEGKPTWQIITIPRSARPQCRVRDEP